MKISFKWIKEHISLTPIIGKEGGSIIDKFKSGMIKFKFKF
jgi:hypothetical protein